MSEMNYALQKPEGFIDQLALKKRLMMLDLFYEVFPLATMQTVLDVGVTADQQALSSNFFEHHFPDKHKIIALSNQDASFLEKIYPGLTFKLGTATQLPFADNSIDVVFSSAVIEHVGSDVNQQKMLAECFRVAKQGVFITTPNRWHPVDAHTLLPFIHWLPKTWHRKLLSLLNLNFYAAEENLNLMTAQQLKQMCQQLQITKFTIKRIRTLGITSNLVLIIKK